MFGTALKVPQIFHTQNSHAKSIEGLQLHMNILQSVTMKILVCCNVHTRFRVGLGGQSQIDLFQNSCSILSYGSVI